MKQMRLYIAAGVMLALILLTVFSVLTVRSRCEVLLRDTDAVIAAAEKQETEAAREAVAVLEQDWRRESNVLRFFVPAETLAELNRSVFRLAPLTGTDELAPELESVRATVAWMHGMELTVF